MQGVLYALRVTGCMFKKHASYEEASQLVVEQDRFYGGFKTAHQDRASAWTKWMSASTEISVDEQLTISDELGLAEAKRNTARKQFRKERRALRSRH